MIKENEKQTYVTGITPNVNYHDIQKIPTTPLHTRILDNLYIYNNIAYFIETNYSILSINLLRLLLLQNRICSTVYTVAYSWFFHTMHSYSHHSRLCIIFVATSLSFCNDNSTYEE